MSQVTIVFVHGWSVTNLNTYGSLPARLQAEGAAQGIDIKLETIYLGQYISFRDEVRVQDISRAFQAAITDKFATAIQSGTRLVVITHSTGGPVLRDWYSRYSNRWPGKCPVSHLIMLAPANFGSALAKLGKGTLSRLDSFIKGVEPGQGVLDWLCVGSSEAWKLNEDWIKKGAIEISPDRIFPFVITGQDIDRKFYDALNSYTGELGSDGVVRCAGANLNATYLSIKQHIDGVTSEPGGTVTPIVAPATAFRIVKHTSHSGTDMGIMAGVKNTIGDPQGADTVDAILRSMKVASLADYDSLITAFNSETAALQVADKVEKVDGNIFSKDRYFIHDKFSMIIFRVKDSEGYAVTDYDLIFTGGDGTQSSANDLPEGFFADRQQNSNNRETVTYFVNNDILKGSGAVVAKDGKTVREATTGITHLGIQLNPRPDKGFVRYAKLILAADSDLFNAIVKPNSTTMIDICLQRLVDDQVFIVNEPPFDGWPVKKDFSKLNPHDPSMNNGVPN